MYPRDFPEKNIDSSTLEAQKLLVNEALNLPPNKSIEVSHNGITYQVLTGKAVLGTLFEETINHEFISLQSKNEQFPNEYDIVTIVPVGKNFVAQIGGCSDFISPRGLNAIHEIYTSVLTKAIENVASAKSQVDMNPFVEHVVLASINTALWTVATSLFAGSSWTANCHNQEYRCEINKDQIKTQYDIDDSHYSATIKMEDPDILRERVYKNNKWFKIVKGSMELNNFAVIRDWLQR